MTVLLFLAVLILLILVHELGHFIIAKRAGIRVDEFGIGFPPKIFGKRYGETEYTLNWLPIGGFVRIWGEDPTEEHYDGPGSERSFIKKPRLVQAAVLVAGVTMNVVLAYVLFVVAFMVGMPTAIDEYEHADRMSEARVLVASVLPDSPAAETLKPSDQIVALYTETDRLDTIAVKPSTIAAFIGERDNTPLVIDIIRRGEPMTVTVTPLAGIIPDDLERAAAGFTMTAVVMERLPLHTALMRGAERTGTALRDIAVGIWTLISQLVRGSADYAHIAGPVGIAGLVGDAAALGFTWLLTFTAVISLNLAIINLLPIPALDGGRLLFVIIESIIRRPIKPVVARTVNQVGFLLLLLLMVVVTANDIWRLFS